MKAGAKCGVAGQAFGWFETVPNCRFDRMSQ